MIKDVGNFQICEISDTRHALKYFNLSKSNLDSKLFLIKDKRNSDIRIVSLNDYLPLLYDMTSSRLPFKILDYYIQKLITDYAKKNNKLLWFGVRVKMGVSNISNISSFSNYVYHTDKWGIFILKNKYIVINLDVSNMELIKYNAKNKINEDIKDPIFFYVSKNKSRTITGTSFDPVIDPVIDLIEKIENGNHPKTKTFLEKLKEFFNKMILEIGI